MNDKWRHIGSPQTDKQKNFVIRLFKPVYLNHIYNKNTYFALNNNSKHVIKYKNNFYKNINRCYYSIKYPELINQIKVCKNFYDLKKLIRTIDHKIDNKKSEELFTDIITNKFNNYNEVQSIINKTLIRPITYKEDNIDIGKIYENIRNSWYINQLN